MSTTPAFAATPKLGLAQILAADTTTLKTLFTAGASGSKVTGIELTSTDSAAKAVQVYVTRSGTDYLLGTVPVAALAGFDGTVSGVNALASAYLPGIPKDNDGQAYILMVSGDVLKIAAVATLTAAKIIHATAIAADF